MGHPVTGLRACCLTLGHRSHREDRGLLWIGRCLAIRDGGDLPTVEVESFRDQRAVAEPEAVAPVEPAANCGHLDLELAVVGQNLLQPHHYEFGPAPDAFNSQVTEVPRGVYGTATVVDAGTPGDGELLEMVRHFVARVRPKCPESELGVVCPASSLAGSGSV